ncbi:Histone-lysine N-methyltransferase E(z) [Trichinella nativa]|uniref:[histone H3]-lysine(27) N-trimethyltransferase n=1 Tax=Trichinella nativa TaxID=6335 RepID=A0A0V1L2S3_9BILA|nr:Histone-lysine N-methyltransferase E(z) [Trichinella nativa]
MDILYSRKRLVGRTRVEKSAEGTPTLEETKMMMDIYDEIMKDYRQPVSKVKVNDSYLSNYEALVQDLWKDSQRMPYPNEDRVSVVDVDTVSCFNEKSENPSNSYNLFVMKIDEKTNSHTKNWMMIPKNFLGRPCYDLRTLRDDQQENNDHRFLPDFAFYKLVLKASEVFYNQNITDQWSGELILPNDRLFTIIHHLFPHKLSANNLKELFIHIFCMLNEKKGNKLQHLNDRESIFVKAFCPICFQFCCTTHGESLVDPMYVHNYNPKLNKKSKAKDPCGKFCYLKSLDKNTVRVLRHSSSKSNASKVKLELICMNFLFFYPEWTAEKEEMLRTLESLFGSNSCIIAECLNTPYCSEVYARIVKSKSVASTSWKIEEEKWKMPEIPQKMVKSEAYSTRSCVNNNKVLLYSSGSSDTDSDWDSDGEGMEAYKPCYCRGRCRDNANCSCNEREYCEKYCRCSDNCSKKYLGCNCKGVCHRKVCLCMKNNRECDPTLCKNCGGNQLLICKNDFMQNGIRRRLYVCESNVHGLGLFTTEDIAAGDFICEYRGEILTKAEAQRRGKIYDSRGMSFLFMLNTVLAFLFIHLQLLLLDFDLDATRFGSVARFINHSKIPNCVPQVKMVLGSHRIAFYATRNIEANEELFFNYGVLPECVKLLLERLS